MSNNQTIDGMRREQLVRWEEMLRTPPGRQELLEELRALLDAPFEPKPTGLSQGWNLTRKHDGFVVGHQSVAYPPDEKAIEGAERDGYVWVPFLVPDAQPQGEPVGFRYRANGGPWELMPESPFADGRTHYRENGEELEPVYAEQPAPVAAEPGEHYAYEYEFATVLYSDGPGKFKKIITREAPDQHEIDAGCIINVKPLYSAEPRKYDDTLLPFLALMRKELHANSDKGDREGWLGMTLLTAMNELTHHHNKLGEAVEAVDAPRIAEYAADVANCAMMVADVCGVLDRA